MATKLKVNYEFVGDSTVPVTRTNSIKHGDKMLDNVVDTMCTFVTPEMFGAKGDGVTDDSNAFENAINSNKELVLDKKYKISRTFTIDGKVIRGNGEIITNNKAFICVDDVNINGITISGPEHNTLNSVGVQIAGLRNIIDNVTINNFGTAFFYHTLDLTEFRGIAYNVLSNSFAYSCEMVVHAQSGGQSWFNENTFENVNLIQWSDYRTWLTNELGSRKSESFAFRLDYDGTLENPINYNKFINCNAELCVNGGFYVCGIRNMFISCRVEGLQKPFFMPPSITENGVTYINGHNYFIGCYEHFSDYTKNYISLDSEGRYNYDNYIYANNTYMLNNAYLLNTNYKTKKSGFVVDGQKISMLYGDKEIASINGIENPSYISMNIRLDHIASAQYPLSAFSEASDIDGELRYCYTDRKYHYWNGSRWLKLCDDNVMQQTLNGVITFKVNLDNRTKFITCNEVLSQSLNRGSQYEIGTLSDDYMPVQYIEQSIKATNTAYISVKILTNGKVYIVPESDIEVSEVVNINFAFI